MRILYSHLFTILLILVFTQYAFASLISNYPGQPIAYELVINFTHASESQEWRVHIELVGYNANFTCSSSLKPNPLYMQTRSISPRLIATSLYYVLDSVCPKVIDVLKSAKNGLLELVMTAPKDYVVRSALDWRGYGAPGGPYLLPVTLFKRYYMYDGIVVAYTRVYETIDNPSLNLSIVLPRGFNTAQLDAVVETVTAVRNGLSRWLGPSPRSPVVIVIASPEESDYMPPGTAHSTGAMLYIKPDIDVDLAGLIHAVAHESAHGWFNFGLLYGDFGFQEGLAEFLALNALRVYAPRLFGIAERYVLFSLKSDDRYATWLKVHAAIWYSVIYACNESLYTDLLRGLFRQALAENGKYVTLFDLINSLVAHAPQYCRQRLRSLLGPTLLSAAEGSSSWPFVNTTVIEDALRLLNSPVSSNFTVNGTCRGQPLEEPPARISHTRTGVNEMPREKVTLNSTSTEKSVTHAPQSPTRTQNVERGGPAGSFSLEPSSSLYGQIPYLALLAFIAVFSIFAFRARINRE